MTEHDDRRDERVGRWQQRRLARVSAELRLRLRLAMSSEELEAALAGEATAFESHGERNEGLSAGTVRAMLEEPARTLALRPLDPNELVDRQLAQLHGITEERIAAVASGGPYYSAREFRLVSGLRPGVVAELFEVPPLRLLDKTTGELLVLEPVPGRYMVDVGEAVAFEDAEEKAKEAAERGGFAVVRRPTVNTRLMEIGVLALESDTPLKPHVTKSLLGSGRVVPVLRDRDGLERRLVPGRLDIWFDAGVSAAKRKRILSKLGVKLVRSYHRSGLSQVLISLAPGERDLLRKLLQTARDSNEYAEVRFSEPCYLGFEEASPTDDSPAAVDAFEEADRYWNETQINLDEAQKLLTAAPEKGAVTVLIVDSGLDTDHEDLTAALPAGWDQVDLNFSLHEPVEATDPNTENSHGTKVAGVIRRIAPTAKILPFKILGTQVATDYALRAAAIFEATNYAHKREGERAVLNLSWSTPHEVISVREAIRAAIDEGIPVVTSAGNYSSLDAVIANKVHYPSHHQGAFPALASVAAVGFGGVKASYTYFGDVVISVAAPGGESGGEGLGIRTTSIQPKHVYSYGTSYAAPHVTALLAMLLMAKPKLDASEAVAIAKRTATSKSESGSSYGGELGAGRINAADAMRDVLGLPAIPIPILDPTTPPESSNTPELEPDGKLNINDATLEQLSALSVVGAWKAGKLIDYRVANGDYSSLWGLLATGAFYPWQMLGLVEHLTV
jgi:DNA uptake protein ComE-like DNA-binding protein